MNSTDSVHDLQISLQDLLGVPTEEQFLVHNGRPIRDAENLGAAGIGQDATITLLLRLVGGKGGFGALLRGQGRDGKITTNYDACRDLNGKRLRHVNAQKKLEEWQAKAPERQLEKVAMEHIKEMAKREKQEKEAQVHEEEVIAVQKQTVESVQDAVQDALKNALQEEAAEGQAAKRKAAQQKAASAKKPKMLAMLEELSDSDSDSGSEESESTAD